MTDPRLPRCHQCPPEPLSSMCGINATGRRRRGSRDARRREPRQGVIFDDLALLLAIRRFLPGQEFTHRHEGTTIAHIVERGTSTSGEAALEVKTAPRPEQHDE